MTQIKTDTSPLDKAVFGALNAGLVGAVFSIHCFNKNFETYNLTFKQRIGFVGRNIMLFSVIYGFNQFITDYLAKNGPVKNKYLITLTGTVVPLYIGYKAYNYKNKFVFFPKEYFLGLSVIFMLIEVFDLNMNKNH
jgi:hypothetical protein